MEWGVSGSFGEGVGGGGSAGAFSLFLRVIFGLLSNGLSRSGARGLNPVRFCSATFLSSISPYPSLMFSSSPIGK